MLSGWLSLYELVLCRSYLSVMNIFPEKLITHGTSSSVLFNLPKQRANTAHLQEF